MGGPPARALPVLDGSLTAGAGRCLPAHPRRRHAAGRGGQRHLQHARRGRQPAAGVPRLRARRPSVAPFHVDLATLATRSTARSDRPVARPPSPPPSGPSPARAAPRWWCRRRTCRVPGRGRGRSGGRAGGGCSRTSRSRRPHGRGEWCRAGGFNRPVVGCRSRGQALAVVCRHRLQDLQAPPPAPPSRCWRSRRSSTANQGAGEVLARGPGRCAERGQLHGGRWT
jgi:hypothetical protein